MLDGFRVLEDVDVEAGRDVPGDVAVEGPDAWVVGVDLDHDVGWFGVADCYWEQLDVASLGVLAVGDGAVEGSRALGEDVPALISGVRFF